MNVSSRSLKTVAQEIGQKTQITFYARRVYVILLPVNDVRVDCGSHELWFCCATLYIFINTVDYCIGLGVVEHQTAIADSAVNGCTAHINCNPVVSCSFGFVFGCRGHNAPY